MLSSTEQTELTESQTHKHHIEEESNFKIKKHLMQTPGCKAYSLLIERINQGKSEQVNKSLGGQNTSEMLLVGYETTKGMDQNSVSA